MFATAAAVAGATNVFGADSSESGGASACERLGVAVIGARGRGNSHIAAFAGRRDTQVLYVCDPDESVGEKRAREAARRQRGRPVAHVEDIREVLSDPRVDIVSIATPDHWQALAAIWSMQAGKDVYVEKPGSHCVAEGRRVVQAARKYDRICQVGLQSRSSQGIRRAMTFLQEGGLGQLRNVRGLCYKRLASIGPKIDRSPPPNLNYDLWLGPAPMTKVTRQRFHHDWRWQWDYGGGELANDGVHQMDLARWGLNATAHPERVLSFGGRFGPQDAGETADTQTVIHDIGGAQLVLEVRGLRTRNRRRAKVGVIFESEEGFLVVASYTSAVAFDRHGNELRTFAGGGDHFGNFLRAVRSRRLADLHADVEQGHRSSSLCHLGNISYRLGLPHSPEEVEHSLRQSGYDETVIGALSVTLKQMKDHGNKDQASQIVLGPQLVFDGESERFVSNDLANKLLTREYRAPYVVPDSGSV